MIALHSVSKELGRGRFRRVVLDGIDWVIPPRSRYVILGQKGSGKTTLLSILMGSRFPTSGWVERKGSISPGRGILRATGSKTLTARQIAKRLAQLYHVRSEDIVEFAARFADMDGLMDVKVSSLPKEIRQRLTYAMTYAIPFDFYLFDGAIGTRRGPFSERCRQAFETRCQDAGVIVATSLVKLAEQFDGTGGVLHEGRITLFDSVDEAISVFRALPPPKPFLPITDTDDDDDDDEDEWL